MLYQAPAQQFTALRYRSLAMRLNAIQSRCIADPSIAITLQSYART